MLSASLREQIKCRWREFRREPSAFYWVVFMPILWMVILGFAFSEPRPEVYGVGWVAESEGEQELLQAVKDDRLIRFRQGSMEELTTLIQRGEINLIITARPDEAVTFHFDPANPEAQRSRRYVNDILQEQSGRSDPLMTQDQRVEARGSRYIDFLIPGLLGLSVMTSSLFGVGMTIVSNRKENLLKRYLATPMKPSDYVVSHLFGRGFVLVAEFVAVMLTGFLLFRFQVHGNYLSYIALAALGAAAFTAVAILCASRTKSIPMISGLTNLITLPMMVLSGVFFSKNNFPEWLRSFSEYLPLTALNDGFRKIALEGQGLANLGFETAVLAVYLVIATLASIKLFKWY
ncbi:MAG: ABC transporter permease [Oligoflexus sp.]